jgi:molybdenum cofactor synthesis domain-containing protein
MPKTAGIILVGNELLSGKTADANATYLCRELRQLGVDVRRISVIPDEVDVIAADVASQSRDLDLVFTSGGVGPTHDDVTVEGVARALGVRVVQHPALVSLLQGVYTTELNPARLKMAEVPEGAHLIDANGLRFPVVVMGNVYILPGVPEIFRQKFAAIRDRFRDEPIHLTSVFVRMSEGTLADFLNELLRGYPELMLGSYPVLSNPEYKVKVTLESRDLAYLGKALEDFLDRLPKSAVVRVE